jgi:hydroxypyruvate reductase
MNETGPQPHYEAYRRHVDELVAAALTAADAEQAVLRHLSRSGALLKIGPPAGAATVDLDRSAVYLVSTGKAAVPMARAALRVIGNRLAGGVIITKESGRDWLGETRGWPVQVHLGGHPLTNEASLKATEAAVTLLAKAGPEDVVLCLISGGTSALLSQPMLSLKDFRKLINLLLKSGCTIGELNTVRRSLDRIKAGGLARAAYPATVHSLILSDVIGNALPDIGSGPTVVQQMDPITEVVTILGRYDIARQMDRDEWQRLSEALRQAHGMRSGPAPTVRNTLVGDVRQVATAVLVRAIQLGFIGQMLTASMEGEAKVIGRLAGAIAKDATPGTCFVMGGETTVTIRGQGKGGRNQETALSAALSLDGQSRCVVASFATDGEDGPTTAAGAVVSGETVALGQSRNLNARLYLDNNDSHTYFAGLDAATKGRVPPHLITTGPTGTNLNDILVVLTYLYD